MLNFFRTNQILAALLYLPYMLPFVAAFWLEPFGKKPSMQAGWLYDLLFGSYADGPIWNRALFIFFLFALALFTTQLVINRQLDRTFTLFPGLFFILFASASVSWIHFSPMLPAMFVLLLSIRELMSVYKKYTPVKHIFNGGFWLAIAAFFLPPINLLLIWEFLLLQRVRTNRNAMDIPSFLLGWLTPNFILGSWMYWKGNLHGFWEKQFAPLAQFRLPSSGQITQIEVAVLLVACLFLLFLFRYSLIKREIGKKRIIGSLYELIAFITLIALFLPAADIAFLQLAAIPVSILFGLIFSQLSTQTAEGLHLLLYFSALFALYSPLLKGTIL